MTNFGEENSITVRNNIIWVNNIKKEPLEIIDCVQQNEITEAFNSNEIDVKIEEEVLNKGDFLDCYKIVEKSSSLLKTMRFLKHVDIIETADEKKQTSPVRINDIQEKTDINSYCYMCRKEFKEYCLKCPMVSHILDNSISLATDSGAKQTIPKNLLYLKETPEHVGVFALKTIPKDVKFGPFEGLDTVLNGTGPKWKIKNRTLLISVENIKYSNWMQYINCSVNILKRNLGVFQCNNNLYYKSVCEIKPDDELLVYFGEEYWKDSNEDVEMDYDPIVEDELDNIYGCTFCMLGFSSEVFLVKHKSTCPNGIRNINGNSMAKIVQCSFCNIHLEQKEYTEYHMSCCCERYARRYLTSTTNQEDETGTPSSLKTQLNKIYNIVDKKHKCTECSYQTNDKHDLKKHEYKHADVKPFKCHLCHGQFTQKGHLKMHMKNKHDAVDDKEFKCKFCPYQTNSKGDLKLHLYVHDTVKRFECEVCGKRFRQKSNLQIHLKNLHLAANSRKFQCPKCPFKTNYKNSLEKHVNNTHDDVAPVVCFICNGEFKQKQTLQQHIKYKHTVVVEKEYKCPMCPYESKRKGCLKRHLSTHDETKSHGCSKCEYTTNCKNNLRHHMYKHLEVKPHSCDTCGKEFARKSGLKAHIKCMHGDV